MTRDDIIKALDWHKPTVEMGPQSLLRRVEALVARAEAAEREACARVCESIARDTYSMTNLREYGECAAAIRARGTRADATLFDPRGSLGEPIV